MAAANAGWQAYQTGKSAQNLASNPKKQQKSAFPLPTVNRKTNKPRTFKPIKPKRAKFKQVVKPH